MNIEWEREIGARTEQTPTCWLWRGPADRLGYGRVNKRGRGRKLYVHRMSWELAHGQPIPPGLVVCHRCDVPACVRPDHLFIGTQSENMADAYRKGRIRAGGYFKLSAADVLAIRQVYRRGLGKQLANHYGVCLETICRVALGRRRQEMAS